MSRERRYMLLEVSVSEQLDSLWAKSAREGEPRHSLLAHLLDVGAVVGEVLGREPAQSKAQLAADLGLPVEQAVHWVQILAALHDLGKATPAFQSLWDEGKQGVLATGLSIELQSDRCPHGLLTEFLLSKLLAGRGFPSRLARQIAQSVGCHHGRRPSFSELGALASRPSQWGSGSWDLVRKELVEQVILAFGAPVFPAVSALEGPAWIRLAGLTSFCDWIASASEFFPYGRTPSVTYLKQAAQLAAAALDKIGWQPRTALWEGPLPIAFAEVFAGRLPRPLQSAAAQLAEGASRPSLLLVEVPTGEGKTEAALHAHLILQKRFGHRGMYVALPTRATGNAMFSRTRAFLESCAMRSGAAPRLTDLQLQHGAALLNAEYADLKSLRDVSYEDGPGEALRVSSWFSHRKRAFLSEYGVGTVDQMLMGVIRSKHHFVRLWGLTNRTVVLDEVHAYDSYTGSLLAQLVRWLAALGSSAVIMSATLPRALREELLQAYGDRGGRLAPYPRVTRVDAQGTESLHVEARPLPIIRLNPAPSAPAELSELALRRLGSGGCLAIILNTVQRAQEVYLALRNLAAALPEPTELLLFHARFPGTDRQRLEEQVLRRFGPAAPAAGTRPPRAILVATQVAEQSLDLDFDGMITDLAPIDLLLQRAGRLHRHRENDPRPRLLREAQLQVAYLEQDPKNPDLGYSGLIYPSYLLWRTWWELQGRTSLKLPDDLETLIDAVYSQGLPESSPAWLGPLLRTSWQEYEAEKADYKRAAAYSWIAGPEKFVNSDPPAQLGDWGGAEAALCSTEEHLSTRLVRPSVQAVLLHSSAGHLSLDPEGRVAVDPSRKPSWDQAVSIYGRMVTLGRSAAVKGLRGVEVPAGWTDHPLLGGCKVLTLVGGSAQVGQLKISLDPELGVVYGDLV